MTMVHVRIIICVTINWLDQSYENTLTIRRIITIISIDPVSGDPLIAKVLYFSDNRVILEGALFVYNFRDPIRYVGIFSRELREEWETSSE